MGGPAVGGHARTAEDHYMFESACQRVFQLRWKMAGCGDASLYSFHCLLLKASNFGYAIPMARAFDNALHCLEGSPSRLNNTLRLLFCPGKTSLANVSVSAI